MEIKVLGTGCKKCNETEVLVNQTIQSHNLNATVEKVEDLKQIARYGVMRTPAVVVNGKVKIVGKVPTEEELLKVFVKEER